MPLAAVARSAEKRAIGYPVFAALRAGVDVVELKVARGQRDSASRAYDKTGLRVCLIIDAGSAGVSPATPEARINHRQTTLLVRPEPAEARICRGSQASQTTIFGLIKHTLSAAQELRFL